MVGHLAWYLLLASLYSWVQCLPPCLTHPHKPLHVPCPTLCHLAHSHTGSLCQEVNSLSPPYDVPCLPLHTPLAPPTHTPHIHTATPLCSPSRPLLPPSPPPHTHTQDTGPAFTIRARPSDKPSEGPAPGDYELPQGESPPRTGPLYYMSHSSNPSHVSHTYDPTFSCIPCAYTGLYASGGMHGAKLRAWSTNMLMKDQAHLPC